MDEFTRGRAGHAAKACVLALALAGLAGCQHAEGEYPSPYGRSRPTQLPPVPGGGLWNPPPIRATGYGAAVLINRLPPPPTQAPPPRSSETPELLTPAQQAERMRSLEADRAGQAGAVERRIESQGRVRGPGPGARPAIDPDSPRD